MLTPSTRNGFFFRDYTEEGLAEGIREALAFHARSLRNRPWMLRRVMRDGAQRFTITRTVDQYVELYEDVLGENAT